MTFGTTLVCTSHCTRGDSDNRISIQPEGRFWQEPEPSQATGMALAYTLIILSHFKFLESVSIATALQNKFCEIESFITSEVGFVAENEECWHL